MGSAFWGTGVFQEARELVLDFAFDAIGARRLEARAAVQNGRGNGALGKIGAVQEGHPAQVVPEERPHHDQVLFSILDSDWRESPRADVRSYRALVH